MADYGANNAGMLTRYQKYYRANAERCKERAIQWRKDNPEKFLEYARKSNKKRRNNPEKMALDRARMDAWLKDRPEKRKQYRNKYLRKAYRENPRFRIEVNFRSRLNGALRQAGGVEKCQSCKLLMGCSPEELMVYIESKFKPGMTWQNRKEWHIDHIRPCSSFDLMIPEQQMACFHYTNLQPLWAYENLSKADKLS